MQPTRATRKMMEEKYAQEAERPPSPEQRSKKSSKKSRKKSPPTKKPKKPKKPKPKRTVKSKQTSSVGGEAKRATESEEAKVEGQEKPERTTEPFQFVPTPLKALGTRKKKKKRKETFAKYIFQIIKEKDEKQQISKKAMKILNSFICDMFDKIARESSHLSKSQKRGTLILDDAVFATRLVLPRELWNTLVEGINAYAKYKELPEKKRKASLQKYVPKN